MEHIDVLFIASYGITEYDIRNLNSRKIQKYIHNAKKRYLPTKHSRKKIVEHVDHAHKAFLHQVTSINKSLTYAESKIVE